jgi:hypothetical protein
MTLSFSKPVKEKVKYPAKVKGASRFEVHSAGYKFGNYAKIMINNDVISTSKSENGGRGINLVVADAFTHKVVLAKSYDTYASAKASDELLKDVK